MLNVAQVHQTIIGHIAEVRYTNVFQESLTNLIRAEEGATVLSEFPMEVKQLCEPVDTPWPLWNGNRLCCVEYWDIHFGNIPQ